jgi:organic radical activating enzyme
VIDTATQTIRLSEIFDSFQGEGIWSGVYQLFVRLSGCTIGCHYCDTPYAHKVEPETKIRLGANERRLTNEWTPDTATGEIAAAIASLPPLHSISFTGGEPLEHPDALAALTAGIRARGAATDFWLETAGLHPDALASALPAFRYLSLDMKLSAIVPAMDFALWARVCAVTASWLGGDPSRAAQVKIVVTPDLDATRLDAGVAAMRASLPSTTLVLQPARGNYKRFDPAVRDSFYTWYARAAAHGGPVRLAPQWQHLIGIL